MNFKKAIGCFTLAVLSFQGLKAQSDGENERAYMVQAMLRIADPVLNSLSRNELKKQMPVEAKDPEERKKSTYLEAFGRLLAGMAPWLELGPDHNPEGKLREKYILLALKSIAHATNPAAADHMNFNQGSQPLVDAAFFAQALLRAPTQLWGRLDAGTRANVLAALKSSRIIKAHQNNWLLFSAEVETAILQFEGNAEIKPIDVALKQHLGPWYKGDGAYGDGPDFHWDYYNSFVIQPMLLEVTKVLSERDTAQKKIHQLVLKRARRYAAVQERMISPEGTYPPLGRSLAYRFGAFQLLSQISLMQQLPKEIDPAQVRTALYTVVKRQIEMSGTFDRLGWLQIGMAGHQPELGESYISTGSLYLCSEVFLILGLKPSDPFWQGRDQDWTAKKLWKGRAVDIDHSIAN